MPFENGSFACSVFKMERALPEDPEECVQLLRRYAAKKLDAVGEEEEVGWVSHRFLYEIELDQSNVMLGQYLFFTLRTAVRKIPAIMLKNECRKRELDFLRETGYDRVPAKKRKEIREDITRQRLPAMLPSLNGFQVAVDRANSRVYFGSCASKMQLILMQLFEKTFNVGLTLININEMMGRLLCKNALDLPPLRLEHGVEEPDNPGRDFMTWWWYFSESEAGKTFQLDRGLPVQTTFDGPLAFVSAFESGGAGELQLKKGLPTRSMEAKSALQTGKKLKKAKIMLAKEEAWTLNFDGDKMAMSGIVLPEGDSMDHADRFGDRIERLFTLQSILEGFFKEYAQCMMDPQRRTALQSAMNQWIENREGL